MRRFGAMLLLVGIAGFGYGMKQKEAYPPVPPGLELRQALDYPAGRWELLQYAGGVLAAMGLLLSLFPKGR